MLDAALVNGRGHHACRRVRPVCADEDLRRYACRSDRRGSASPYAFVPLNQRLFSLCMTAAGKIINIGQSALLVSPDNSPPAPAADRALIAAADMAPDPRDLSSVRFSHLRHGVA